MNGPLSLFPKKETTGQLAKPAEFGIALGLKSEEQWAGASFAEVFGDSCAATHTDRLTHAL